jgi:hypothetical protein
VSVFDRIHEVIVTTRALRPCARYCLGHPQNRDHDAKWHLRGLFNGFIVIQRWLNASAHLPIYPQNKFTLLLETGFCLSRSLMAKRTGLNPL